jgi:hypothetical protein
LEKKKPKPVQTDRFRFGSVIFGKKPVQTSLAWFFRFGSVFPVLARFVFSLAWFFSGLGLVWFFRFQVYKTETKSVGFFKTLIGFFSRFSFFSYFFPV